jgi:TRAP transporter TAXI family solute receptor
MVMYGNLLPVAPLVVRNDSDIKSTKDLKGKRVASEYGGNASMREIVTAALASVGLTWNDVKPVPVPDAASGMTAVQEGRADAACGGTPTHATAMQVDAAVGLRMLNFGDLPPEQANNPPKELVDILQQHQPGATIYLQKKEGFLKSDATSFHYPEVLVASSKVSPDVIYQVTKALYEYDKELQPVHAWTKDWKQETMFNPNPSIPYHEGAVRFWKEIGKWTPEAEANQQKLLGQ